ncbi:6-phosphofructokinase [Acetobacterium sp.]|uniref:6-phosphofructokinase n=1 Tax=Acetobacterium sp. TaxID=1872094 RepID=UPI002F40C9D7
MTTPLKGACIIGQSGGPTSVVNASALGCIEAALASEHITKVYGAANGIKGVLGDQLYDLDLEDPYELSLMKYTPSSEFGTCRYKLKDFIVDDTDYKRILDIFRKYDIRYFFYNGGNDSMDTCSKISSYLSQNNYECRIIGIPKTVDNDLIGTDHCPGYGSAAKFVATSCMEIYRDAKVYGTGSITILEFMGRNAGWLTASSALATYKGLGPDLIYLPEIHFDLADFIADVSRIYEKNGDVLVAVSEGIMDKSGTYISAYFSDLTKSTDAFGHSRMGGLAAGLANFAGTKIDTKVRGIEFGLTQRCAAHIASGTDIEDAYTLGRFALEVALEGATDQMVGFERIPGKEYQCRIKMFDLIDVANAEKKIPREWINAAGNHLLPAFIDYALPLIQGETKMPKEDGLPRFANLKKIMTREI